MSPLPFEWDGEAMRPLPAYGGMSLREHFAGLAMCGLMFGIVSVRNEHDRRRIVDESYAMADAMLAARKVQP